MATKKQANTATATATPARVANVNLAFVNLTTLNAALKEAGIKVDAKTPLEKRVALLAEYENDACKDDSKLPEDQRRGGVCSVCDGMSQLSRPGCPFCGTDEDQPAPEAPVAAPAPKSAKALKEKENKESQPKPKAIVKVADAGKVAKINSEDIAKREKRIGGLVRDGLVNAWKIGREMLPIYKDGLWKYHLVEGSGETRFKSFNEWVTEIFQMAPQTARNMMAVAENFSEAKVREVGITKLAIALRVPPEMQAEVLEKAATTSKSELEAEVRRLAPGGGRASTQRSDSRARPDTAERNRRGLAGTTSRPKRIVAENEVTAVFALQRYEVPMFARAKSAETDEPLRAKNLNADPHAVLALSNGVELHIRWVEEEEGLVSVVEFKRVSEQTEAAE